MWKGNYLPSTVFLKKLGQVRLSFLKSHPASCFCPPSVREDSEAVRKRFLIHLWMTLETWVKPLKTWLWLYRMYCDKLPWRRERLPTSVFWPGESHGLYSPGGRRVGPTAHFHFHFSVHCGICEVRDCAFLKRNTTHCGPLCPVYIKNSCWSFI